jgi:hypothetical protein
MSVIQPKILDKLGLLPKVNSISINRNNSKSYVKINFEIDCKIENNKNPWIFDQNILQMIDFSIILCFNKDMQLYLLNNNEDIYKKIINNKYKEGIDYVQFFEKLQTAKLNFSKKKTQFAETLSTGFIYDFNLNKDDFTDLSVFIGLSLNKERISEKFKIGQEKIKQTFGTFYNELFIYDNKYVNSKINDISIFKNKEKLKFNKFETFIDLDKKVNKFINNKLYFSELFSTVNEKKNVVSFFYFNIEKAYKDNSVFSFFYNNKQFIDKFFSKENDYNPYFVKIKKKNKYDEKTLYESSYDDNIDTNLVQFKKIKIENSNVLYCLVDKTSSSRMVDFQYEMELSLDDKTLLYLSQIKQDILSINDKFFQAYNIASNGNYYLQSLNKFSDAFLGNLKRQNIMLEDLIIDFANILMQFSAIDEKLIDNIKNIASTKFYNFEILDLLIESSDYLKSEIIRLENFSKNNVFNVINVNNTFKQVFKNKHENNFVSIFSFKDLIPNMTSLQLNERVTLETERFYKIQDINNDNKFTYFSPIEYNNNLNKITQTKKISDLDFNSYNEFYINYYMSKIHKGEYEKLSKIEKLLLILQNEGIDVNSYTIVVEKNENLNRKELNLLSQKDNRLKFDEKLLFDIFIDYVVIKNKNLFSFSFLNYNSNDSKVYKFSDEKYNPKSTGVENLLSLEPKKSSKVPAQINSIALSYKNDETSLFSINDLDSILDDKESFFAIYSNYKNLYKLQYYNENEKEWKDFDKATFSIKSKKILCKTVFYLDYDLQLVDNDIYFEKYNEYFILENIEIKNLAITNFTLNKQAVGSRIEKLSVSQKVNKEIDKLNQTNIIKPKDLEVAQVKKIKEMTFVNPKETRTTESKEMTFVNEKDSKNNKFSPKDFEVIKEEERDERKYSYKENILKDIEETHEVAKNEFLKKELNKEDVTENIVEKIYENKLLSQQDLRKTVIKNK